MAEETTKKRKLPVTLAASVAMVAGFGLGMEHLSFDEFKPRKLPQVFAACMASIAGLGLGTVLAWPSPCLPNLIQRNDFNVVISPDTLTWIVSITFLGALVGGPFGGFGIETLGRRGTLLILTIPFIAANLIVAFSTGVGMMLAGRALAGFSIGMSTLAAPAYIAEIAAPNIRGILGSIFDAMLTFGTVMTFILGAFVNWRVISYIHSGVPVLLLLGMLFAPESPIHLLAKGDFEGAKKSLAWLRGARAPQLHHIDTELRIIQKRLMAAKQVVSNAKYIDLIKNGVWQPTVITLSLVLFNQLSGVTPILSYSVQIISATNSGIDPNVISAVLGSIAILATVVMDLAGRRVLLMISEVGMSVSLVIIGLFFYLEEQDEEGLKGGITWMPLVALVTYNLFYNIGLGPLPRVVSTEILPQRVKGLLLTISLSLNWTLAFVVTKTFATLRDALNPSGFFWLYGGICAVGTVFFFIFLPETRGKTFAEIEKMFVKDQEQDKVKDKAKDGEGTMETVVVGQLNNNLNDVNQNEVQHL